MTGSLQTKNEMFYMVLNIRVDGKRKQKWIATGLPVRGNKRKAEELLRKTLSEYDLTFRTAKSNVLFADYIRLWLDQKKREIDEVTYQGYEVLAKRHLIPYFEKHPVHLNEVSDQLLQDYMDEKYASGRLDGKGGLSARSLRLHKNILNQVLSCAVKNKLIGSNPCEDLTLPSTIRFEANYYSCEQIQEFFEAIHDDPLYPLFFITLFYGLRRSEVLGLQWDSFDSGMTSMTIRHTVSKVTKVVEKDKTKNASSHRTFPLTKDAAELIRNAKKLEAENRRLFGNSYQENDYVFKWDDGRPYSPDYITRHFSRLLKKHHLEHIRFHELRHSCASLLLNNGSTLKDVQDWLGHADIKMTANIYGHLDLARKKHLANQLCDSLKPT